LRCTACGKTYDLRGHSHLIDDEIEERLAFVFTDRC